MAENIQVRYNELEDIIKKLDASASCFDDYLCILKTKYEKLIPNSWQGRGADQFQSEMDCVVFKGTQKLSTALQASRKMTQDIIHTYEEAEQEAGNLFKQDDGGPVIAAGVSPGMMSSAGGSGGGAGIPASISTAPSMPASLHNQAVGSQGMGTIRPPSEWGDPHVSSMHQEMTADIKPLQGAMPGGSMLGDTALTHESLHGAMPAGSMHEDMAKTGFISNDFNEVSPKKAQT